MDKNIPVVDLNIGNAELKAVSDVIKSKFLIEGKNAREFEKKFAKFTGSRYVSTIVNGTCALHLALTSLGIGPGDEVITTSFTFIASSNAILFNGSIPIFVDIDPNTFNIDPEEIEKAITPKTKAIIPVHIFGNPCEMKKIKKIADKHDLKIIEDCAQAHDAHIDGIHVGNFGDLGIFSFYGTKNLVGGEGGAIITNNKILHEKILSLKNHGRNPKGGYNHCNIGYNYRITDMQAAIMNIQIDRAKEILSRRHRNGKLYRELFKDQENLLIQKVLKNHQPSDYILAPVIKNGKVKPENIIEYLKINNIQSRTIYNIPTYNQPCYQNISDWVMARVVDYPDYNIIKLPNTEFIAKNHFELPMVSSLSDEQIRYIVKKVLNFF